MKGVFGEYQLLEWLIEGVNPDLLTSDFSSSPRVAYRGIANPSLGRRPRA